MSRVLLPSREDLPICFFYQTTLEPLINADRARYLHLQLPLLFSRSDPASALHLATQAISLAAWARSRPGDLRASELSRRRYSQSLAAMNAAIRDPVKVKSDDTLYAVLLLSGYETITFDSEALFGWGTHIDGAASLLRSRGIENFSTPFACNMFLFIRRNAIQSHLQISKPIDPIFDGFAEMLSLYENFEDRLLSKAMRIPALQSLANNLLSQPSWAVDFSVASELIEATETLDGELAHWARCISKTRSYTTVMRMSYSSTRENPTSSFVPNQIHRYSDFYAARVWNLYRVYRLILQSILLRASPLVQSIPPNQGPDYIRIEKINRVMVDDVCASVPFLLGYDLSELKNSRYPDDPQPQDEKFLWPQSFVGACATERSGKFSLIWPLYVACSVASVPESQRMWMRSQLKWIAATGEAHAHLIMDAESQTLLGGPEIFRFDCV
ncbi:hypothetical protein N431DRAFT_550626 [Stipitochalara longipes BDJ]|nr:hypothetical protein N431DRAFT_550626 [Stipitochalara longipes BDJ]